MTFFLHSTAARLACLRQELGLSAENLSAVIGVPIQTLQSWERGQEEVPDTVWDTLSSLPEKACSSSLQSSLHPRA